MMQVLPDVADRVVESTTAYLREVELERLRLVNAYILAEMGFSL